MNLSLDSKLDCFMPKHLPQINTAEKQYRLIRLRIKRLAKKLHKTPNSLSSNHTKFNMPIIYKPSNDLEKQKHCLMLPFDVLAYTTIDHRAP
jgi:hypothetical protein